MNSVISSDGRYVTVSLITTVTNGPPFYWGSLITGYIYQYDNQNNTWTQLTPSQSYIPPYIYRVALKLSPANNNTMFIGGMYLTTTTDGASSWFQIGNDPHSDVRAIEFDPSDATGNTLFVGNDGGVSKATIDLTNGSTWASMNNGLAVSTLFSLSSSALDAYQIIASMQDNGNNYLKSGNWTHLFDYGGDGYQSIMDSKDEDVFYTTDGSFIKPNLGNANNPSFGYYGSIRPSGLSGNYGSIPLALNPLNPSSIYAAGGELFKSTKGDATTAGTWTQISNFAGNFPSNSSSIFRIAVAPSDTQTIYVSDFYGTHLFKTTVGGGTSSGNWTDITPTTGNPTGYTPGYVIAGLAVSTTDANRVWIGYSGWKRLQ